MGKAYIKPENPVRFMETEKDTIYRSLYLAVKVDTKEYNESCKREDDETGKSLCAYYKVRGNTMGGYVLVDADGLQTLEDVISKSGKKAAIEQDVCYRYNEAITEFMNCNSDTCMAIWGCKVISEALTMDPSEFIGRWEHYKNMLHVGEIWEHNEAGFLAIILPTNAQDEETRTDNVRTMFLDGTRHTIERKTLAQQYHYTGRKCESLMPFIKELQELEKQKTTTRNCEYAKDQWI